MRTRLPVLSGLVIGVVAAAALPSGTAGAALVPARGELVVNGGFDGGATAPWWSTTNTPITATGGQLRATVPSGTVNPYDAIVGQSGIVLTSGRPYTLVFDAAASVAVSVRVTVQLEASPYTAALDQQVALDPTLKRYTLPFTSSLGTTTGQVTLQVGGRGAFAATVDNVSLTPAPLALTSGFYSDPDSNAYVWLRGNGSSKDAPAIRTNIAERAGAKWFGNWNADVSGDGTYLTKVREYVSAADAAGKLPILAAYNITGRDCGGPSQGGAGDETAYRLWISRFANAIGDRPAIVVIEPDAVNQSMVDSCMTGTNREARWALLRYATERFRDYAPNTWAYLDGGNYGWNQDLTPAKIAYALHNSGVRNVRGFAVNVSNFYTTGQSTQAGTNLNAALTRAYGYSTQFVVDTSRNGNGGTGEWCNPAERKLGVPSQAATGGPELLLWVKVPGDSDGPCGTAPAVPAGTFNACLAIHLVNGTRPADGICRP